MSLKDLTPKLLGAAVPFDGDISNWQSWSAEILGRLDAYDACAMISKSKDEVIVEIIASLEKSVPSEQEVKEFEADGHFKEEKFELHLVTAQELYRRSMKWIGTWLVACLPPKIKKNCNALIRTTDARGI
jgi:hypothetical protein